MLDNEIGNLDRKFYFKPFYSGKRSAEFALNRWELRKQVGKFQTVFLFRLS